MADGLSLIANVIAVGGLVVSSSQGLIDLVTTIRNASSEIQSILDDTRAFCNVIAVLNSCLREPERQNAVAQDAELLELVANLKLPMQHCAETITLLKCRLRGQADSSSKERPQEGRIIRMITRNAVWFFKKRKEVERLLAKLDREKHTLTVLISALNLHHSVMRDNFPESGTAVEGTRRQPLSQNGQCGSDCTDLDFALKRYLGDTSSISFGPPAPGSIGPLETDPEDTDPPSTRKDTESLSVNCLQLPQSVTDHLNLPESLSGSTAEVRLWWACSHGSFYHLLKCWEPGIDVNATSDAGLTCLHMASSRGESAMVQFLINQGANVMARACPKLPSSIIGDSTPLHTAANQGRAKVIMQLLEAGADPNAKDAALFTPLHRAYMSQSQIAFLGLLNNGAQCDELDGSGLAILHRAAADGDFSMVSHLLEYGATIDLPSGQVEGLDKYGLKVARRTPLHMAALMQTGVRHEEDRKAIIDLLARKSPQKILEARDSNGYTPLHVAAENESCAVLDQLLGLGANPNAQDDLVGETPLHKAARMGRSRAVQSLLSHSADPSEQSFLRQDAKELAGLCGHNDIVGLIDQRFSASSKVGNMGEHALYQFVEKLSSRVQNTHSICI